MGELSEVMQEIENVVGSMNKLKVAAVADDDDDVGILHAETEEDINWMKEFEILQAAMKKTNEGPAKVCFFSTITTLF